MHKLMDAQSAVGATGYMRIPTGTRVINIRPQFRSLGTTKISVVDLVWQASHTKSNGDTGLVSSPLLAVGTTAENIRNYAFSYRIAGTNYTKAAVAAGTVLSGATNIAASKFGGFKVYIETDGTVTTKPPGTAQTYANAALATVAIDAITNETRFLEIGKVLIANDADAGGWDAATDDMTDASDVTTATFVDAPIQADLVDSYQFDPSDLSNQSAQWNVEHTGERYGRLWLRTLTGTGEVDAYVSFR